MNIPKGILGAAIAIVLVHFALATDLQNIETISPISGSPLHINGTLNLMNFTIANLSTPTIGTDAATKAYVDSVSGSGLGGLGESSKVAYWSDSSTLTFNTNLHWDNSNIRLGIGDDSPLYTLDVSGTGRFTSAVLISSTADPALTVGSGTTSYIQLGDANAKIYRTGNNRIIIRSEGTNNVAQFTSYGIYLPRTAQTIGLLVESPVEARSGIRFGTGGAGGNITAAGVWQGDTIAVAYGGTGSTTASGARSSLSAAAAGTCPSGQVVMNATTSAVQCIAVGTGDGSVTSVGLSMPGQFSVTGSPVTTAGTLTASWNDQSANAILAGPTAGGDNAPTFRALVNADIPATLTGKTYNGLTVSTGTNTFTLTRGSSTLTRSGAHALTLTTTGATSVTLPTSGTLATTAQLHDAVTLTGNNYLSLSGQQITAGDVNLASHVTGTLPVGSGGTGSTTASGARSSLSAAAAGTCPSGQVVMNATTSAVQCIAVGTGDGSVTSVDVSGGTTGLTTSGGPITTSGTITIGGTLAVASGGTGSTTASGARSNLDAAKTDQTMYIGTTAVAINRGSGTLNLAGIGTLSSGAITSSGGITNNHQTLATRMASTSSTATQIPVFTADPSGTTRTLVTRTPAQLRSDIGAGTGDGTITGVTAGSGLTGGGTSGSVTLNVGAGTGISVGSTSVSFDTTWGDARYITGVTAGTGLTGGGTSGSITINSQAASTSQVGHVTTGSQSFAGAKTFTTTPTTLSAASHILSFSSTSGTKQITTGGSTHLNLNPGGNVGIGLGTSSPADKLDVDGDIRVRGGNIKDSGGTSRITFSGTNIILNVG